MHVYHYGGYESGAIKRLMQRHATCVDEVDRLLRGDVLVDLLNVVRQGVRASVESYSLKQIEKFYMPTREGPVTEAGFSVVAFETWLKERRPDDPRRDRGLQPRRLRLDVAAPRLARGAPGGGRRSTGRSSTGTGRSRRPRRRPTALNEWLQAVEERVAGLTADLAPDDRRSPRPRRRRLLADLLDWHRREEKSQWWRWFELKDDLTVEQLVDERDALGRTRRSSTSSRARA